MLGAVGRGDRASANSIIIFIGTLLQSYESRLGSLLGGIVARSVPALLIDFNVNTYLGLMFFAWYGRGPSLGRNHR